MSFRDYHGRVPRLASKSFRDSRKQRDFVPGGSMMIRDVFGNVYRVPAKEGSDPSWTIRIGEYLAGLVSNECVGSRARRELM